MLPGMLVIEAEVPTLAKRAQGWGTRQCLSGKEKMPMIPHNEHRVEWAARLIYETVNCAVGIILK
jgi:hypothetical protein